MFWWELVLKADIQYCDFYPYTITEERLPKAAQPYMQEIKAFTHVRRSFSATRHDWV
jgi:hypothetical protein